jgi:hypothetical protein
LIVSVIAFLFVGDIIKRYLVILISGLKRQIGFSKKADAAAVNQEAEK